MSSKHLQARKALSLNTGIFGLSSIGLVGKTIASIVFGGFGFGVWAALALLIVGVSYFRGSWKAFGDLEYKKSKSKGIMASVSSVAGLVVSFLI